MTTDSFYSKSTRIKSPTKNYGMAKIIGGIILIVFFLPEIFTISNFLQRINVASEEFVIAGIFRIGISVILLISGFGMILNGFKNQKKITITPELPPPFNSYMGIKDSIIKGKLEIYKLPEYGPLRTAYSYISDKVPFLAPLQRNVVALNISFVKKFMFLAVTILVLYYIQGLLPRDFYRELSLQPFRFPIPYLFLIFLALIVGISVYSIFLLVPGNIPKHEKSENIATINGGGDPNSFCAILEKSFLELRFNDLPNRNFKSGFKKIEELNFNDTGSFEGVFAIETHPKFMKNKSSNVYLLYLGIAVITLCLSIFYLKVGSNLRIVNFNHVLNLFGQFFMGIILFRTSLNFYKRAYWLTSTFNYESIFAVVDVEGTIGKTEITAGKAITDSLETKNTVIRSDSQLKVYTTKILSENNHIASNRYITAMVVDDELNNATAKIMSAINNFRDEGVAVRGIDIKSESLNNITQANLLIQEAKKKGKDLKSISGKEKPTLEAPKEKETDIDANHKECPRCAEIIKLRAKVCRYCGHELE